MKRRELLKGLSTFGLLGARAAQQAFWSRAEPHMGCLWTLTLPSAPAELASEASTAVFAEIRRLNSIFSDYESDSELNRLCARAGGADPVAVSPELFAILSESVDISRKTDGLFDITLGPCTRLWRRSRRRRELPEAAAIADAKSRTGWEAVELDAHRRTVRLKKPRMQLDLGGIAKGWTQDLCLRLLRDRFGLSCVLLDAAGEVAAGSPPPGKVSWQIGLTASDGSQGAIPVKDANVATSGDLHQFVEIDGVRFSHIIDPASGLGCTTRREGTVLSALGALSDPLAKVLCLKDSGTSLALLRQHYPEAAARVRTATPAGPWQTEATADFPEVK